MNSKIQKKEKHFEDSQAIMHEKKKFFSAGGGSVVVENSFRVKNIKKKKKTCIDFPANRESFSFYSFTGDNKELTASKVVKRGGKVAEAQVRHSIFNQTVVLFSSLIITWCCFRFIIRVIEQIGRLV